MNEILVSGSVMFLFGLLSAKWAMELGYSQLVQLTLFCVALFFGPLVLLLLYIRMIYRRNAQSESGAQMFGISRSEFEMKPSSKAR